MVKAPDWTEKEFQILLSNHNLSDEELADILQSRTSGAVGIVRAGLHSFHKGGDTSMLSKMMVRKLEYRRSLITCPRCGVEF